MTKYVVGFMFDTSLASVALIRKNKPAWQAGLLNGIGGKIEDSDVSAAKAMVREFSEEAGMVTFVGTWKNFCNMSGSDFDIEFFANVGELHRLKSMTDEQIEVVYVEDVLLGKEKTIGNLPWLITLALDFERGANPPVAVYAQYK